MLELLSPAMDVNNTILTNTAAAMTAASRIIFIFLFFFAGLPADAGLAVSVCRAGAGSEDAAGACSEDAAGAVAEPEAAAGADSGDAAESAVKAGSGSAAESAVKAGSGSAAESAFRVSSGDAARLLSWPEIGEKSGAAPCACSEASIGACSEAASAVSQESV